MREGREVVGTADCRGVGVERKEGGEVVGTAGLDYGVDGGRGGDLGYLWGCWSNWPSCEGEMIYYLME